MSHYVRYNLSYSKGVFFRDKLLGTTTMPIIDDLEEWIYDEEDQPIDKEMNPNYPTI